MSTQDKSARTTGTSTSKITDAERSLQIAIYDLTKMADSMGEEIEALASMAAQAVPNDPRLANIRAVLRVIESKAFDVQELILAEARSAGYPWDFDEETGGRNEL